MGFVLLAVFGWVAAAQSPSDSLKNLVETTGDDSIRIEALITLARIEMNKSLLESVDHCTRAVELSRQTGSRNLLSKSLTTLGGARYYQGSYDKALDAWLECLSILREREGTAQPGSEESNLLKSNIALLLNNVGVLYKSGGEYDKAIEYYQENFNIQAEIGDLLNMARSKANIGNVYFYFGLDYLKALDYYEESLEFFEQYAEKHRENPAEYEQARLGMANILNNIGLVYKEQKNYGLALENYRKALKLFEELESKPGIAQTQSHIGIVYLEGENYSDALMYSQDALRIYREIGQRKEVASALENIGSIYYQWGKYDQALQHYEESLQISKELNLKKEVYDVYKEISDVYAARGNFRKALDHYQMYVILKDSVIREENLKQISEMETKYETERKERENELLKTRNELQESELAQKEAENKRQRVMIYSFVGIFLIVLVFSILLYRQYSEKKKANILLEEQNIKIKNQRDQIFQQKKEITDSIQYASRIQTAILPPDHLMDSGVKDNFILYKPRDIVSGDYYWMTHVDGKTIIAAADCTGHGVPGAFMSMLGIAFMNEIVNKIQLTQPSQILNQLRENVVHSLHQTGQEGEAQDGMDIALCVFDSADGLLQYSGANNPLYLIRNDELIEYKADKMPIGIFKGMDKEFSNHEIVTEKGDCVYIFSDGFVDQFGGDKGKKFMSKNFKRLLLSICAKPMKTQGEILDKTIKEWRGEIDQIDDILVMGFRI